MVLRKGSTGSLVKYLQRLLNWQGNALTVDGDFGTNTYNAVRTFQTNHGLEVDGIVGTNTWARLLKSHVIDVEGVGPTKLVNVAKFELNWGFVDENNNDKTPYGEWYGQNGSAWSGMFISWCARQAGILNSLVPRFSDCPAGVAWYQSKERFHARNDNNYTPKVGDVVFFWSSSLNTVVYSGIVTEVTSSIIKTIEGNCNSKVSAYSYNRTNTYIHGYGCNTLAPTTTDVNNAYRDKWRQLLECVDNYNVEVTYNFAVETLLLDLGFLRVKSKFTGGLSAYNNADATITAEIENGELTISNKELEEFINSTLGYVPKLSDLTPVIEMSRVIGDGELKISFSKNGTFLRITFAYGAEIEINSNSKHGYTYEYIIEVKENDLTTPQTSAVAVYDRIRVNSSALEKGAVCALVLGACVAIVLLGSYVGLNGILYTAFCLV